MAEPEVPRESEAAVPLGRIVLAHERPLQLGPLRIEPAKRLIARGGDEEILEPRVMQVLVALLRAREAILSRDDLIQCCWDGRIVGDDAINRVMSRLRRSAEGLGRGILRIETVTKVGYRLIVDGEPDSRTRVPRAPLSRRLTPLRWAATAALTLAVALSAYLLLRPSPSPASAAELSLAVLPFRDLSPQRDSAYFAEGVAEEIMGLLSNQPNLRVAGRSSAATLGPNASFREARSRLGVTHLLEGTVRRQNERVRISVRLLQTSDGMLVWSQVFERPVSDIFAVQDEIGASVAARLRGTFDGAPDPGRVRRTSTEVYDLYLAANNLANRRTYDSLRQAQRLLERAISLDPDYAPAHARLGFYIRVADQLRPSGSFQDGPDEEARARRHIERALALAPNLAEAHAAMGMLVWTHDPRQSLVHHGRALELDPGNYLAWNSSGNALSELCRPDAAIANYRRAASIEPLLRTPYLNLVLRFAETGRFAEAEAIARRHFSLARDRRDLHRHMVILALHRGDLSSAAAHGRAAIRLGASDPSTAVYTAFALEALGLSEEAVRTLPEANRQTIGAYWSGSYDTAVAAAGRRGLWFPHADAAAVARSMIRTGEGARLLRLFRSRFATLEDFDRAYRCDLPQVAAPIVQALQRNGQGALASRLLALADARLREAVAAGYNRSRLDAAEASLRILGGDVARGLDALERAAAAGWLGKGDPLVGLADPVFDAIRDHPRFRAVERRIAADRAREQREFAAATAGHSARGS